MKKISLLLISTVLTTCLFTGCNKTQPTETTAAPTTVATTSDVFVSEPPETEKVIPEGYIDGDIDYFEDVPEEWRTNFTDKVSNDSFTYEAKGMYIKKYFLDIKFIEPVIILKITNTSSEAKEWDLYSIKADVNTKSNDFARTCEVKPGETIYRFISIPVDAAGTEMTTETCIYTIGSVKLNFKQDAEMVIDFTSIEQPQI